MERFYSIEHAFHHKDEVEEIELWSVRFAEFPQELLEMPNLKVLIFQYCYFSDWAFPVLPSVEVLHFVGTDTTVLHDPFPNLKELILHDEECKQLPIWLPTCQTLETLAIIQYDLKKFPLEILALSSLKKLSLEECEITDIPNQLTESRQLEELELINLKFTDPHFSPQFPFLKKLLLKGHKQEISASWLSNFPQLSTLILSDCHVEELPVLVHLEELKIENMNDLPLHIDQCPHLKMLSLVCVEKNEIYKLNSIPLLEELELNDVVFNDSIRYDFFEDLTKLKKLLIHTCELSKFPKWVLQNKKLEELCLINTHLEYFPEELVDFTFLKKLELNQNHGLTGVLKIDNFKELEVLNVERTLLTLLPPKSLTKLNELCIGAKQKDIFQHLTAFENLEVLSASDSELTEVPQNIGCLTKLKDLSLSQNNLTSIPDSIHQLSNLIYLFLNKNQLTQLPESISQLVKLEQLSFSENPITHLPKEIGNLTYLENFKFYKTQISTLPDSFCQLTYLTELEFSYNQLKSLPQNIGNLTSLKKLDIVYNQIETLPESIGNCLKLEILEACQNQLKQIPATFEKLEKLEEINLADNCLESIVFGNFKSLKYLYLSKNKLKELPVSIGNLHQLKTIDLSYNQLEKLPMSFGNFQLRSLCLDLSYNQLAELPTTFSRLNYLEKLYLNNNNFTVIPDLLQAFDNLTELRLGDNNIQKIDESFFESLLIEEIDLRNNPLPKSFFRKLFFENNTFEKSKIIVDDFSNNEHKILIENLKFSTIQEQDYVTVYQLAKGEKLPRIDPSLLFKIGSFDFQDLQKNAINHLLNNWEEVYEHNPLKKGSEVVFIGQSSVYHLVQYQQLFTQNDIVISNEITDKTTHVIAIIPYSHDQRITEKHFIFIPEFVVASWLRQSNEEKYVNDYGKFDDEEQQNILALLENESVENRSIGLSLVEGSIISPIFLLPILAISITSENKIKEQAERLLLSSGNQTYYDLVQSSESFQTISSPNYVVSKLKNMCDDIGFSKEQLLTAILTLKGRLNYLPKILRYFEKEKSN